MTRLTEAAYQSLPGGPLDVPKDLYTKITQHPDRTLISSQILPIRSGVAVKVPAGHLCRIVAVEGAQVGDLNIWNYHNPRERLWASRTRQLQQAHVSVFDRLWSTLPYLRPLCTITGDSLKDYGTDGEGGRVHDLLGTRCDPYVNRMLTGKGMLHTFSLPLWSFTYAFLKILTTTVIPISLGQSAPSAWTNLMFMMS